MLVLLVIISCSRRYLICINIGDKDLISERFQVGVRFEKFWLGFLCIRNGDNDSILARFQVGMRSEEFWLEFL